MRSPLGYCRVTVGKTRRGYPRDCRRWVRRTTPTFPFRCPAHEAVPATDMENMGALLRAVYFDGIERMQQLSRQLYRAFGPGQTSTHYEFPARMVNTGKATVRR